MKYFKKVVGERLYLSPVNTDDFEQYTAWINDSAVSDNLGVTSQLMTIEKEKDFLTDMVKSGYNFAIVLLDGDRLIGNASLHDVNQLHRNSQCGLFIGDEADRGKGYGTEALRLLLSYGFNALNLHNIMLKVFSFNKNAIDCYTKLGFKVIGERRDAYFVNGEYHNDLFMDILAADFFNSSTNTE